MTKLFRSVTGIVVLVSSLVLAQDTKPSLGVMEATLVGQGFDPELRPVFTSLVRGKVVDLVHDSVDVMEGSKLEKLVANNAKSCSNAECLVQFTRSIGVDYLLETRLLYRKGNWTATIKLASAASASLLAEKTEDYSSEADAKKGLPQLAAQAVQNLVKGGGSEQDVSIAPPPAGAKKVIVAFASTPSGAAVSVDGRISCTSTPCKRPFLEGTHRVEMVKDGYHSRRESVALSSNGQDVTWTLSAIQGRLSLDAVDDRTGDALIGDVYVDGVKVGQTPYDGLVAVSTQRIEVAPEGFDRQTVSVALEEGKTAQTTAHFRSVEKPKVGAGMVAIPAGCFQMGSISGVGEDDEHPQHRVCVSAFSIDAMPISNSLYRRSGRTAHYGDGSCYSFSGGKWEKGTVSSSFQGEDQPVVCVDWTEASSYCQEQGKRLPTEAEYEYANRAGTSTKWFWGNDADQGCNYANGADQTILSSGGHWSPPRFECQDGYGDVTSPVGHFKPNPWGLYDMTGNVWEWVSDWYGANYYGQSPSQDPRGPGSGSSRVSRGGSWGSVPAFLRSARRYGDPPGIRSNNLGFRCVSP